MTRIPAQDVTFIIPVQIDHSDRVKNLVTTVDFLTKHFDCNIIIGENAIDHEYIGMPVEWMPYNIEFQYFTLHNFHRTRMLNDMTRSAGTLIVFNYDADVIIPPAQIEAAIQAMRNGADIAYPFDGTHALVERVDAVKFWESLDVVDLDKGDKYRNWHNPIKSVGGAVGYKVDSFWKVGGENENFISYGPEDSERWHRYRVMGLKVARIGGPLYHIQHWIGPDSSSKNSHFEYNNKEIARIKAMTKEQLQSEINSWSWAPYKWRQE